MCRSVLLEDDKNKRLVLGNHIRKNEYRKTGNGQMIWNLEDEMAGWIIALISGALMSLQGIFNTEVTKQTSIWVSAGWVQFTAFVTCLIFWLFGGRQAVAPLFSIRPWYLLAGGVMGAFITWTVIRSMAMLKPAQATLIIVVAQIVVSYLVELAGMFGVEKAEFEWKKLLGAAVAILGILIFK